MAKVRPLQEHQVKAIKALMKAGHIRDFDHLFSHLKASEIAGMLGSNTERITRLKTDRTKLYLQDIFRLAEQLDISHIDMYTLLIPEEEKPKPPKRRKK